MVPIDQKRFDHPPEIYRLEAFASTDPQLAESGVVLVKFSLAQGTNGFVTAQVDAKSPVQFGDGKVTDEQGHILAFCDRNWRWERQSLHARLSANQAVVLAVPTQPLDASTPLSLTAAEYSRQRESCASRWKEILSRGMNVETPEQVAARIRRALPHVPAERIIVAPDCGLKYLPRDVAFGKMQAMVAGAAIVRRELQG